MPVPDYQTLMRPVLEAAAEGEVSMPTVRERVAVSIGLSGAELEELLPSGRQRVFDNRVAWAKTYMEKAGLLESVRRGVYRLTDAGRALLSSEPERIDNTVLTRYPAFEAWRARGRAGRDPVPNTDDGNDTPEERLERDHAALDAAVRAELIDRLRASTPAFFEQVVVDVLIAMGYGGGRAEMGRAIGRSSDGGIDGVINEDALGLEAVYIQAKKYGEGVTVGAGDLRNFSGALDDVGTVKGVFVTTSTFTEGARQYAARIPKRIVLIDGEALSKLMVRTGVGVRTRAVYEIRRLDEDYFAEE